MVLINNSVSQTSATVQIQPVAPGLLAINNLDVAAARAIRIVIPANFRSSVIDGMSFPALYAGPQPQFPGLDQVNVPLSLSLRGAGVVNVTVTVDGVTSNPVQIDIM